MDIFNEIVKVLKARGIKSTIIKTTEFKSLGLDSLDLMDMVIEFEEKNNIMVPDDKLNQIKTVADMVKIIEELK